MDISPKTAIPKGMPRCPVFPIKEAIVKTDLSLTLLNKNFEAIYKIAKRVKTITKYQKGVCISERSNGRFVNPQKVKKG